MEKPELPKSKIVKERSNVAQGCLLALAGAGLALVYYCAYTLVIYVSTYGR